MYRFVLWLVPTVEKFPRRQKFLLGDRLQATALDLLDREGSGTTSVSAATDGGRKPAVVTMLTEPGSIRLAAPGRLRRLTPKDDDHENTCRLSVRVES